MSEVNGSGFIVFHALLEAALSERLMDVSLRTRYTSADGTDTDTGDGFRATDGNYGMGMYKVCWCGGDGGCTLDEHFSMHVATLIINGMMLTVAGNGQVPNRTSDMVDPLTAPSYPPSKIYTLAGKFFAGMRGDYQPAYNAELWSPSGLALDKDQRIDLAQTPLNAGIIETVAGNGFKGRAEEGQLATQAELDTPTGVAVDLNQMLWICDSGNNVLRVVSMEIPVRIPSTNEFRRNIILTAAGGATGSTTKGDGGVAWLARMQAPSGVAVSSAFISNEDGTLPVNVYISEAGGQQVRTMSLEYQSYLGVINTCLGVQTEAGGPFG
ncbi:FTP domain-containing protein [Durusdinium trenchii]|uniref:FTP domain-containing protein n=1 Tax=Durusdinium trenchii TaxID=1381693 RepID=A0ABP0KND8_9DINO